VRLREALPQDTVVVVRIGGDTRFLAVVSPIYLAERPPPPVPDELRRHRCICHRPSSSKPYCWEFKLTRRAR
jgi:hypothetical protein